MTDWERGFIVGAVAVLAVFAIVIHLGLV